jgi:hypothetical protein
MTARLLALSLLLLVAAGCDTRVPPTMSNPTGSSEMAMAECPAGSTDCPEELAWWERMLPWNWF